MSMCCSFDNAEVYAGGKAEEVMGQAIKVCKLFCAHACCSYAKPAAVKM